METYDGNLMTIYEPDWREEGRLHTQGKGGEEGSIGIILMEKGSIARKNYSSVRVKKRFHVMGPKTQIVQGIWDSTKRKV